jgi:long-chain fatty acid transport protein
MTNKTSKTGITTALACAAALASGPATAAGFLLLEQSGSGTGNAFAGSAAAAEDASTIYFNPAGMMMLPGSQVAVSVHGIDIRNEFSGSATDTIPLADVGAATGGNIGNLTLVPNLYVSAPIRERWAFGVGVNGPFGLKTEYDAGWLGRYQAIKSEIKTLNINPSAAFKVSESLSLGVGVSWQKAEATLTRDTFVPSPGDNFGETSIALDADDDSWGWNVGALFRVGDRTKIGLAYRSAVTHTLEGNATAKTEATGATFAPGTFPATAEITLPDTATASLARRLGERWEMLGDLMYTHWSRVEAIDVVDAASGATQDSVALRFDDTWRLALGASYRTGGAWTFKGGVAYDESPVTDAYRTARLPDSDRIWLAAGAKYRFSEDRALDFGYAHLFFDDAPIDQTLPVLGPLFSSTVTGTYSASTDILSLQLTWTF